MDTVIETLATGLGDGIGWMAESGVLFGIFAVLWIAFGAALVLSAGSVDQAWQIIRDLPLLVQGVVWLLFLPVMVGLWIWQTSWPLLVRLVLVLGVAGWNLLILLPKALQTARRKLRRAPRRRASPSAGDPAGERAWLPVAAGSGRDERPNLVSDLEILTAGDDQDS